MTVGVAPAFGLYGRQPALDRLAALVSGEARLVTVTGVAGIGKSGLVSSWCVSARARRVVYVPLSDIQDAAGLRRRLAAALDPTTLMGADPAHLIARLAERGPRVLWLDGADGVGPDLAAMVPGWLSRNPALQVVITRRLALGLAAEHPLPLGPLAPDAAGALFAAASSQLAPSRSPDPTEPDQVSALVRALGGNPLTIIHLAAWWDRGSLTQMLRELSSRPVQGAPEGDQGRASATMHRVLSWSWASLHPWEQRTLAAMSLFPGGFDLSSAEQTLDLSDAPAGITLPQVLLKLLSRAWIRSVPDPLRPLLRRFNFARVVRAFLLDLVDDASAHTMYDRFTDSVLSRCEQLGQTIDRTGAVDAIRKLELERANLEAVRRHALGQSPEVVARATLAQARLLQYVGPHQEKGPLVQQALTESGQLDPVLLAQLLDLASDVKLHAQDLPGALADLDRGLALLEGQDEARLVSSLAASRGGVLLLLSRLDEAEQVFDQGLKAATATGDANMKATILCNRAWIPWYKGDMEASVRRHLRGVDALRVAKNQAGLGVALQNLGTVQLGLGETEQGWRSIGDALSLNRSVRNHRNTAKCEALLGLRSVLEGQRAAARRHLDRATVAATAARLPAPAPLVDFMRGVILSRTDPTAAAKAADDLERYHPSHLEGRWAAAVIRLYVHLYAPQSAEADRAPAHLALADAATVPAPKSLVGVMARLLLRHAHGVLEGTIRPDLEVGAQGGWFRVGRAPVVDLSRRGPPRTVLAHLAAARLEAPGTPVDPWMLIDAAWPSGDTPPDTVLNRLYVTVSELRRLGLREVLLTGADGWLLDPNVPCWVEEAP